MMKIIDVNPIILKLVLLTGVFLLWACQENDKESEKKTTETKNIDSVYQLEVDLNEVELNDEATEIALEWDDYMATQTELEQWKDYSFSEVLSTTENLRSVTDSLRLEVPEAFKNKPIQARLKTLASQADMLDLYVRKSDDNRAKYLQARSILTTFVGLKRQMNEVFMEAFTIDE